MPRAAIKEKEKDLTSKNAFALALAVALPASAEIVVTVDPSAEVGPIKAMNAVNNGPSKARADQSRGNFADYKAARFGYARTHDSINQATSNGHTVDISAVFPDFDADESDPRSYDFAYTDEFLRTIVASGTEPFFRLGQTIENGIKKYHVRPPKDFAKWARVCERVMAHYLEGWADGFAYKIDYWEIWNEPDAQPDEKKDESCQWGGTRAEFFAFYRTVAQHLKARFPDRKVGGPSLGFREDWADAFLAYQRAAGTPIDFFSFHWYGHVATSAGRSGVCPSTMADLCRRMRARLDRHGYVKTEAILNEWNFVKGWTDEYPYSCVTISQAKGGAFAAASMSSCQDAPVDMLMYYDARPGTVFNGLFDFYTYKPRPAYCALFNWSLLRDLGTQVRATVETPGLGDLAAKCRTRQYREWYAAYEMPDNVRYGAVTAVAARGADGRLGILVTRYNDDNNITSPDRCVIRLARGAFARPARAALTDDARLNTLTRLVPEADGSLVLSLEPNAFVYVEY